MASELKFDLDARESIQSGINLLAEAVGTTLGPRGNLVIIGKYANGKPHVTKDGVTVAKNIHFDNEFMEIGAELVREAALKQLAVGDGTTTTTVLAQALIAYIEQEIAKGRSKTEIKKELDRDLKAVINFIVENSKQIESISDLEKVATISANNDQEIGKLISDAFEIISKDGVITVDESNNTSTSVETISGMQFDRGYVSPYFCTDNVKNICELDKPYILITNEKINRTKDIIDIVEFVYKEGKPLLLIAEDFDSEVINNLAVNLAQGLKICCIKCPSFGEYRTPVLEDLAILTNGSVATYENTIEPKDITPDMLGQADKVIITKTDTTIIGGSGDKKAIEERVKSIKQQLSIVNSDPQHAEYLTHYYEKRIARLSGGVAIIHVGGTTELEMKERKDRIDDAVAATKAAIEEGIVVGGGKAYVNVLFKGIIDDTTILGKALKVPMYRIVESCDVSFTEIYEDLKEEDLNVGYDAVNEVVVDLYENGVIDPAKTVRLALLNAVSVAELYLMTDCVIAPITKLI